MTEETYYLDLYALATLATRLPSQPLLHCPVVKKELPPHGRTLWTLPHSSWPSNQPLPNFCTFGFYMFNPQTGSRLLQASQTLPPPAGRDHFSRLMISVSSDMGRMGEVYMTGLLALEAGLSHSDLAHLWTLNPLRQDCVSRTNPTSNHCRLVSAKLSQHRVIRSRDLVAGPLVVQLLEEAFEVQHSSSGHILAHLGSA